MLYDAKSSGEDWTILNGSFAHAMSLSIA